VDYFAVTLAVTHPVGPRGSHDPPVGGRPATDRSGACFARAVGPAAGVDGARRHVDEAAGWISSLEQGPRRIDVELVRVRSARMGDRGKGHDRVDALDRPRGRATIAQVAVHDRVSDNGAIVDEGADAPAV